MNAPEPWSLGWSVVAPAIPALFAVSAVGAPQRAGLASAAALGLAFLAAVGEAGLGWHAGVAPVVMLALVTGIGAVIVRYSLTALAGERGRKRYLRWLLLTLASVTTLVISHNLLVMSLAWAATSIALHQLLTFYSHRTAALVAAHKKFLVSRLADGCLAVCLVLVYRTVGSFELGQISAWVEAHPALTPAMEVAAVFMVVAVALKSAQLPFHGWLMQVMEAPTPVSALLHAGVVNIGGFVLIGLAPWVSRAEVASGLLVVVGLVSTVVAGLVTTTRVSVKVALAWSTCAQMGFMLVQCGLGLWSLALLHLVAHSLYKAHAFLSAGSAVEAWRLQSLTRPKPAPSWGGLFATLGAVFAAGALSALAAWAAGLWPTHDPVTPLLATLVTVSLVPLLTHSSSGPGLVLTRVVRAAGVAMLYVGWHLAAGSLLPSHNPQPSGALSLLVGVGLVGLFVLKLTLEVAPEGRMARTLYPWLFAGLYLDERFTRLTFRLWPPRLEARAPAGRLLLSSAKPLSASP